MQIAISNFVPFEGQAKAYKGRFDTTVVMGDTKVKIRDCHFFNNGEKSWVNFPDKKKQIEGKWQHDYSLIEVTDDNDKEKKDIFMKQLTEQVVLYLKNSSVFDSNGF